jgi:hypothetical protein
MHSPAGTGIPQASSHGIQVRRPGKLWLTFQGRELLFVRDPAFAEARGCFYNRYRGGDILPPIVVLFEPEQ